MTEMKSESTLPSLDDQRKLVEIESERDIRKARKKAERLAEEARNEQLRKSVNRMTLTPEKPY